MQKTKLDHLLNFLKRKDDIPLVHEGGIVVGIAQDVITIRGLSDKVSVGYQVIIHAKKKHIRAEVIRVDESNILVKSFDDNIQPVLGDNVFVTGNLSFCPDISWCGRVINSLGKPLDGKGALIQGFKKYYIDNSPFPAMERDRVKIPLSTGIKVIDIFTPLCFGQRIGIFAGSGVGKSTLLAMMSQTDDFDIVVLALTGERGREVRDMLDDTLKDKTHKVIAVVATSDESAMMRRLAPITATTIAESFSDQGKKVLLIIDSITRYALAAREIAIAAQEPPVARGYPPSVFSQMSKLLERAGPGAIGSGSITGIYAVLVDGDDHNEPISDAIRGVLDGHIILNRDIASRGRFPAVDVSNSISRLANECWSAEQKKIVRSFLEMIASYEETRDLRAMGVYKAGNDTVLDKWIKIVPLLYEALQQDIDTPKVKDPYFAIVNMLKGE